MPHQKDSIPAPFYTVYLYTTGTSSSMKKMQGWGFIHSLLLLYHICLVFWHAILTSFYISNGLYFLLIYYKLQLNWLVWALLTLTPIKAECSLIDFYTITACCYDCNFFLLIMPLSKPKCFTYNKTRTTVELRYSKLLKCGHLFFQSCEPAIFFCLSGGRRERERKCVWTLWPSFHGHIHTKFCEVQIWLVLSKLHTWLPACQSVYCLFTKAFYDMVGTS